MRPDKRLLQESANKLEGFVYSHTRGEMNALHRGLELIHVCFLGFDVRTNVRFASVKKKKTALNCTPAAILQHLKC